MWRDRGRITDGRKKSSRYLCLTTGGLGTTSEQQKLGSSEVAFVVYGVVGAVPSATEIKDGLMMMGYYSIRARPKRTETPTIEAGEVSAQYLYR